jgi:predicted dehydrogenase
MLNAAIVGLGGWGQRLVESIQTDSHPRTEALRFTHAAVRNPSRVADFCQRQSLQIGLYADILDNADVDAVVLTTPHSVHADQVAAAAAAGKHVFVEKPLALTKSSAEMAAAACQEAGVVLALGHNRRFLPALQELKAMIDRGELGELLHIEGNFSGAFALGYRPGMWRTSSQDCPAGGLTAMGIHLIDAFIHLCGSVESVTAHSLRRVLPIELDDTTVAVVRFASGMSGYLTTMMATAWIWRLQVFGTKGWVHMRDDQTLDVRYVEDPDARYLDTAPKTLSFDKVDTQRAELEAFAEAVSGRQPYPVAVSEVVHGIAVMESIIDAAGEEPLPISIV